MHKILKAIKTITFIILLLLFSFNEALANEFHLSVGEFLQTPYTGYDYEKLYKLLDEYNSKKINIDQCVIDGIKFLKSIEPKIRDKTYKKSAKLEYNSPFKFLAFTNFYYRMLSKEARNELNTYDLSITKYFCKNFTMEEIYLLKTATLNKRAISFFRGTRKYYDVIEAFDILIKNNKVTYSEAAIYMYVLSLQCLPLDYNIDLIEFSLVDSLDSWIYCNHEILKKDHSNYKIIQYIREFSVNYPKRKTFTQELVFLREEKYWKDREASFKNK